MADTILVWFRNDLRLSDHPALHQATLEADRLLPVYLWIDDDTQAWTPGAASRWYLHHSLCALADDLATLGSRLVVRNGTSAEGALLTLARETEASAIYVNESLEPVGRTRDMALRKELERNGLRLEVFDGNLLHDPQELLTTSGAPYQVFTPFWRRFQADVHVAAPLPRPEFLGPRAPASWPESIPIAQLGLLPRVAWDAGLAETWTPGEGNARRGCERFVAERMAAYHDRRDLPGVAGTSCLSPALHFGEISPRTVWDAVDTATRGVSNAGAETFLREIGWREFAHHVLHHFPHTPERALKRAFDDFPWTSDAALLEAWSAGRTGYPIVDAGMRELWRTGWMHNRVRMVTASFLTKHLLQHWLDGARWFWDTLVDADLANNTMGWQWSAGCGADAQPFFRIFNPMLQGAKFDGDGSYVRRWVPEIARLPDRYLHAPWDAPAPVLRQAGVSLGVTYPKPVVAHGAARARALEIYEGHR